MRPWRRRRRANSRADQEVPTPGHRGVRWPERFARRADSSYVRSTQRLAGLNNGIQETDA